ncbi:PAS-associated C-terminal [Penicillium cinerascens]|uniref:PAS-associated C-terminal n=1 Tax=Penicillium cinerascens TaxID=70096 RepID=A0A9W9NAE7_9EURO|nr:PAS-associated C-terminal [Penicillium cinerascens]KAJ5216208.1 PAS-associated C-terminal [Penicillium cinerascens]
MDIPDIPDNRPARGSSSLSYPSTIVLDEIIDTKSEYINQQLGTPPNEPREQFDPEEHKPRDTLDQQCTSPPNHYDADEIRSQTSDKSRHRNFYVNELPLLQAKNPYDGSEQFNPVNEEIGDGSFDLVAPYEGDGTPLHSLERQADTMFCSEHMLMILTNPRYLARFRDFLVAERPMSIPVLTYYLNTSKALKALQYANSLVRLSVDVPTAGVKNAKQPVGDTANSALETRVQDALEALTAEELPAFITSTCISITSKVVEERVRGTLPEKFQGTSDALAEVFCLTDPSRPDNPIIFASGEFHRTTQYGMDYVLGRNCRFLQGPKTNPNSVRRIREGIQDGRHHSELFLNYRRDGTPFMNLLQCAPLCDSHGKIRYFIGAQIDVSGLAMDSAEMGSLRELKARKENPENESEWKKEKTEFQQLGELFSPRELQNVHAHGGNLFQPVLDDINPNNSRLYIPGSADHEFEPRMSVKTSSPSASLTGVYKHYLLVRPYPSLRVLFTSPSLQIPGMLQSSFLSRIGDTGEKRDSILHAMIAGRSVTARIKWVTRFNSGEGRYRWIHCTPLLANNGEVGVWMVVVIDDDDEHSVHWKGNWPSH